jgi:hypothetical protein
MSEHQTDNNFLSRWSARKHEMTRERRLEDEPVDSAADIAVEPAAETDSTTPSPDTQTDPARLQADLLTDADMPAVESLTADSDISGFFSQGVSAALRKVALRQVFRQPIYNVRDGLDDYDDDYTIFAPLGDTVTSDMKFHAARREREKAAGGPGSALHGAADHGPADVDPADGRPIAGSPGENGSGDSERLESSHPDEDVERLTDLSSVEPAAECAQSGDPCNELVDLAGQPQTTQQATLPARALITALERHTTRPDTLVDENQNYSPGKKSSESTYE